jgi:hypothetical protein
MNSCRSKLWFPRLAKTAIAGGLLLVAWWSGYKMGEEERGASGVLSTTSAKANSTKTGQGLASDSTSFARSSDFLTEQQALRFGEGGPSAANFIEVLSHPRCLARSLAFSNLLAQISAETVPQVLELLQKEARAGRLNEWHGEHEMLWERWAELDGLAACTQIFANDQRFDSTPISTKAIRAWAGKHPQEALAWLQAQQDIPLRDGMMFGALDGFALADPVAAHEFITNRLQNQTGLQAHGYWRVARKHLADGGLEAVCRYQNTFQPDHPAYRSVTFSTADMHVDAGTKTALDWLNDLPENARSSVSKHVRSRLLQDKPDDVVATLANSNDVAAFDTNATLRDAVAGWAKSNPNAVGNWLKGNLRALRYDTVAAAFAQHVQAQDPTAAVAWARTIKARELREATLSKLAAHP